nr:ATP synthase F0 subunit 8 [Iracundus signifer]
MPQLNPRPWLLILLFSWLCFLTLLPPKITSHLFPNPVKMRTTHQKCNMRWVWPWLGD